MNKTILIGKTRQKVTLTSKEYLAAGGEAEVYSKNGMVYKLYHDSSTKMLPVQKMQELASIQDSQVVIPQEVLYDIKTSKPIGYTTKFIDNAEPILKLFNKSFKVTNNLNHQMVAELVKKLQITLTNIHNASCLAVDFNELNILIQLNNDIIPWFIDTDSYATPTFKATAIMDSVRDRKATFYDKDGMHYRPTVESDWFSWAIITFWIYTNIHPFRGNHPNYKPKDKQKQMDDGISVFDKDIRLPHVVEDFKVIPQKHLDWYKLVFVNNERGIPPRLDVIGPILTPSAIITITGNDKIEVKQVASCGETILSVQQFIGVNYVVSKSYVYSGNNKLFDHSVNEKILIAPAAGGSTVSAHMINGKVEFKNLYTKEVIGTMNSKNMFERNGAIYTIANDKLMENTFTQFGTKLVHVFKPIENVNENSSKMYNGCIIQNLLGKKYLTLPYDLDKSFSKYLPNLDNVRIIDAKSDKNITVVIGEEKGKYNRYVIVFDKKYQKFEIRVDEDIAYEPINFAVLENGLCMLLVDQNQIQLFSTAYQFETLNDPPFDSSMPLFATSKGFFFINDNSIHQLSRKN